MQSRLKSSILTCRIPTKNRGLVGGSLAKFSISILANFKILNFFNLWALTPSSPVVVFFLNSLFSSPERINSVQTRCIVKGEAQKSPLFWRFLGGFWFSQDRLFSRNSTRNPLNLINPRFLQTPLVKPLVFTMHLVCTLLRGIYFWAFFPSFRGI